MCARERPRRDARLAHAGGRAQKARTAAAPFQDRHAAARERAQRRFFSDGGADGRQNAAAVLVFDGTPARKSGGLLPDLHHGGDAPRHPRESGSQSHLLRRHRGRRPALLSVDRDEDRPLSRQAPPSALHRAHGPRYRRTLHSGLFVVHARGGADRNAALGQGP